jgi:hypothetical protein
VGRWLRRMSIDELAQRICARTVGAVFAARGAS